MPKKNGYNHDDAAKLENYVRMKSEYRQQLGIPAMRLYHSLPYLERKGCGLCQPFAAKYPDLRKTSFLAKDTIKAALLSLKDSLCEVEIGLPIKGGKKATVVRRYTLKELMSGKASKKIIDYTPEHAQELARIMRERTFVYGADPECQPYWNPNRTGRISASRPPIQNDSPKLRAESLKRGCANDEVLIHCDIKRAEPTVTKQLIGYTFKEDPYEAAMRLLGISCNKAKGKVNSLAYCEHPAGVVKHWPKDAQEVFMPYAEALDAFKAKLWKDSKPQGRARRFVKTLGGSKVYAEIGGDHDRGTIFSWMVQGTIADIINEVSLQIIDGEEIEGDWRFCFPEHDAVYVIGKKSDAPTIAKMIEQAGEEVGITLKVKTEVF